MASSCQGFGIAVAVIILIVYHTLFFLEFSSEITCPKLDKHQRFSFLPVTVYSLDGILVFGLLFVCTCAYFKKVPRLKTWLLSEKKGVWGVFYKAAVIGTRLHAAVAIACVVMAFYVLFIK